MPGMDSLQCFPVRVEGQNLIVTAARSALKENWKRSPSLCSRKAGDDRVFAIVGAGAAGGMCAETLRKEGYTGRIVMIGKEPHAPYDRTKLSKVKMMLLLLCSLVAQFCYCCRPCPWEWTRCFFVHLSIMRRMALRCDGTRRPLTLIQQRKRFAVQAGLVMSFLLDA